MENEKPGKQQRVFSKEEEIANSITHGIGAALSVAGLSILVVFASIYGDVWRIVSFSIYGASLVILYLASTFYHAFQKPKLKGILKVVDHSSIFVLIAGTYTPFLLVSIRGGWGWSLFGVIWGLALLGIGFKTFFIHRYQKLSLGVYLLMGWLCVIAMKEFISSIPFGGMLWLIAGGLSYTVGVIFYINRKWPYGHAIWHLFVLAGSICHYFAILLHLLLK